jgi:hypothetical protein
MMVGQQFAYSQSKTEIYIPLDNRKEMRLAPKVDTLLDKEEFTYKMYIDPQYRFSELYCDRGLAVKIDNFLRVTPNSNKKSGIDTITLRIVLFGNNNRVLLYKHFFIKVPPRVYATTLAKQKEWVLFNNMALERNMSYKKENFVEKGIFYFQTPDKVAETDKKVVSVTISLVNKTYDKSFLIKGNQITPEILGEIKKQKLPTQIYVRLEVKTGKKNKSLWTRFNINSG